MAGRPNENDISAWWRHHEINFQKRSCPVCESEGDWELGNTALQIPLSPGASNTGGVPQFVRVTCNHCGYLMLFDGATVAGQVGTPTPDPYAPSPKKPKPKHGEGKRK